ncbi:MAG: biotin--[acetyl-CoA-carboxylase] ligase, partial [Clostridia bacterium]
MAALATRVLKMLEARRGDFLSGQEIADENDVSRTAVWKAISALRASGHVISAVTRQGYRLENSSDRLSEAGIRLALGASFSETEILIYDTLPSTNTTAKELATRGASRDAVVLAEGQSSGRGRRGREFFSPYGSGLYMSVLINLDIPTRDATVLTLLAANSVCRALQKLYAVTPEIKWVNDIFIGKHKVCGILTEALNDVESARMTSAIIGIGINVSTESAQFPKELRD